MDTIVLDVFSQIIFSLTIQHHEGTFVPEYVDYSNFEVFFGNARFLIGVALEKSCAD